VFVLIRISFYFHLLFQLPVTTVSPINPFAIYFYFIWLVFDEVLYSSTAKTATATLMRKHQSSSVARVSRERLHTDNRLCVPRLASISLSWSVKSASKMDRRVFSFVKSMCLIVSDNRTTSTTRFALFVTDRMVLRRPLFLNEVHQLDIY